MDFVYIPQFHNKSGREESSEKEREERKLNNVTVSEESSSRSIFTLTPWPWCHIKFVRMNVP